jgi:hypothetical protein
MATVILLKNNDLTKNTTIGGNVDPVRYWSCVKDAQETLLNQLIGDELYDKLQNDFSANTLTGVYQTLYDKCVKPIVIHQAASLYLATGAYMVSNAGITKTSTDNTTTVDKNEVDYMVFHQRNIAKMYERKLFKFLHENKGSIPEYHDSCTKRPDNHFGWLITNNQNKCKGY